MVSTSTTVVLDKEKANMIQLTRRQYGSIVKQHDIDCEHRTRVQDNEWFQYGQTMQHCKR